MKQDLTSKSFISRRYCSPQEKYIIDKKFKDLWNIFGDIFTEIGEQSYYGYNNDTERVILITILKNTKEFLELYEIEDGYYHLTLENSYSRVYNKEDALDFMRMISLN